MKNVLILFGGRSAEHEISIISARNVINALDRKKFNPILVLISRSGNWHLIEDTNIPNDIKQVSDRLDGYHLCSLIRRPEGTFIITDEDSSLKIDIAFPVLHGPMGEDGTIQGMFEILRLPYVGSGVLASSICMDKDTCKRILIADDLPIVPFVTLRKNEIILSYEEVCEGLQADSFFIKACTMGSSIGVYKVSSESEYLDSLDKAFEYSTKVMIEKAINNCREIECAVLGNKDPIASTPGEVKPSHEFYSYEAKYLDPNGADIQVPAEDLTPDQQEMIKEISLRTFLSTECRGMLRVDLLMSEEGEVYISDLNPIPGFTDISMFPKMCDHYGIKYPELISTLLNLAEEEFNDKEALSMIPEEVEYNAS